MFRVTPATPADRSHRFAHPARLAQLVAGLIGYGVGIGLMVRAAIGVPPWDVLAQGLARVTSLDFGLVTNLIGLAVLLLWIPLRQRPGVGTVLNVLLVGTSAQMLLWLVPDQTDLAARVVLFAGGISVVAISTGVYLGVGLGAGPRDGLMTGLHARFGIPLWVARTGVEVSVLGIGWLLGGDVGIGTLVFALLIGPMAHAVMPWFARPALIPASRPAEPGSAASGSWVAVERRP